MVSRFSAFMLVFVLSCFLGNPSVQAQDKPSAAPTQTTVQTVDQGSFFCQFACSAGACASSKAIFEKCKLCPQSMVSACLMGASGVPAAAALNAAQSGQMLPPPGCAVPEAEKKGVDAADKPAGAAEPDADAPAPDADAADPTADVAAPDAGAVDPDAADQDPDAAAPDADPDSSGGDGSSDSE